MASPPYATPTRPEVTLAGPIECRRRNLSSTASRAVANPLHAQTPHTLCEEGRGETRRVNWVASAMRRWRDLDGFWFGEVDLAPLAVLRVLFGLQLVNWVWQLYPNLIPFFTDDGMLAGALLRQLRPDDVTALSFFGQWWQVCAVWVIAMIGAVALTVGYRTRTASILCFVTVQLFVGRNPLVTDGSDQVFRLVPLWLAFTAAGDRYALDAFLQRKRGVPPTGLGPAFPVRVLELQVAWIYLMSGLEKLTGSTWVSGTALAFALQLTHTFARPWAVAIVADPNVVRAGTWATLGIEIAFLPLVFSPLRNVAARWIAIIGAAALHVSILVWMNVGNFPVIMLSLLVLFVPGPAIDRLVNRLFSARSSLPFETSTAPRGRHIAESTAVLSTLAVLAFASAVPWWPAHVLPPHPATFLAARLGLAQQWDMFAPDPTRNDGALIVSERLADGTSVQFVPGKSRLGSGDQPTASDSFYSRWTKLSERLPQSSWSAYLVGVGRMYCRAPSAPFEVGLFQFQRVAGSDSSPAGTRQLWSSSC
jgi:hypothetical protein